MQEDLALLYSVSSYRSISSDPGIYLFLNQKDNVLYIGKAKNLKKRVSSYFQKNISLGIKTRNLVSSTTKIKTIVSSSEIEALLLEANFIKKYLPKYNSRLTDGKAYPMIKITVKDKYPKILIVRKTDNSGSLFFGPYPNTGSMRLVIKTIRRIFPFQSVLNHPKRMCLYYHLKLCPCPPVFDSSELKKDYKKSIMHISQFLDGKSNKVLKDLEKERDEESRNEGYEKAGKIQAQIDAIKIVINPSYKLFEEEFDPNLKDDAYKKEESELIKVLKNTSSKVNSIKRVECYDISNITGKYAVGSMTVLANGQKNTSLYRKFKIRYTKEEPNDFAMMEEILTRRFNHPEWPFPDLLVVDGGKGQVLTTLTVLKRAHLEISLIGLAKREETIITSNLKEIRLPKDSKALLLIMKIRDEAHRFAITYHRNLRSKGFLVKSTL